MNFNHYFTNDEIAQTLSEWAAQYPNLCAVSELGRSYEDRPIWLLTITDQSSGAAEDKPAVWIDANIHATELAGTTTALMLAERLLTAFGDDQRITRILQNGVYYIAPRLNPDGAALAMANNPSYVRSGTRLYPFDEKLPGLHPQDINQDGRILQMRIADPAGDWKISTLNPRLLQKRAPYEYGGTYYRLFPEGLLQDFDGVQVYTARPPQSLDFNRNFPFEWRTENEQYGAGEYPASEPEIRAIVAFVATHRNINLALSMHTFGRVLLRPYSTRPDSSMITEDLWVFELLSELGKQQTGYRSASTFHDFKYHPKEVTTGGFDDWMYDHWGVFAFTVEIWDLPAAAGLQDRPFIEWYRKHPHEEDLKILEWIEQHAPQGFVDWFDFEHPQLGRVELGGWDMMYTWRNPPVDWMNAEAEKLLGFSLTLGDLLPHLQVHTLNVRALSEGVWLIDFVLENHGFLPTYTSLVGKQRNPSVVPPQITLNLPEGAAFLQGKRRVPLAHLEGRSNKLDVDALWNSSPTDNRVSVQWVVAANRGAEITLDVQSSRAGNLYRKIVLA